MRTIDRLRPLKAALIVVALLSHAVPARAQEVRVMTSGGLAAAHLDLVATFEQRTSQRVVTDAISTGVGRESIPSRIRRSDPVDVVMLSDAALTELIKEGRIVADSRVPIARSGVGMAVRAGAPKPDISSLDALKRALLQAKSIALSPQVSGVYLSTELFPRLGIAAQMHAKTIVVERERVGAIVARGEAEIGFQQISELLPVKGLDYVGPLPPEVQRITTFSAGIASHSGNPAGGRALIAFFSSPEGRRAMTKYGLEPITRP
jgi:molybdate transport system substrate-binding protein